MAFRVRNLLAGSAVTLFLDALLYWRGHMPGHQPAPGLLQILPGFGFGYVTYLLLGISSGNRKVTNASGDVRQAALTDPPPPGYGQVFVYRKAFVGRAIGFDLLVDSVPVAQLKSPRFTRLLVPTGEHVLSATRPVVGSAQRTAGAQSFSLAAGESAIFKLDDAGLGGTTLPITRQADAAAAMARFRTMTMVLPDPPVPSTIARPSA